MSDPLAALALACAGLALVCSGWAATRSTPARVHRAAREAQESIGVLDTEWRTYRASLDAWLEEASGVLESVERKRRRISGAVSKLDQANGGAEGEPDYVRDPEGYERFWAQRFRARGLL